MPASKDVALSLSFVDRVLRRMHLEAMLFQVSPVGPDWKVTVRYKASDGWRTAVLSVTNDVLRASGTDERAAQKLVEVWRPCMIGARWLSADTPMAS